MIKMPNQPVHIVQGRQRFVPNRIVEYLLSTGPADLTYLMVELDVTEEERAQFAQLTGYSVSGWGMLTCVTDEKYNEVVQMIEPPVSLDDIAAQLEDKGYDRLAHHITSMAQAEHHEHKVAFYMLEEARKLTKKHVVTVPRGGAWTAQCPAGAEDWETLTGPQPTEIHALAAVILNA